MDRQARGSDSRGQALQASLPEALAPNIRHAQDPADLQGLAVRLRPELVLALAHAPDSERGQALERVQAPVAHRRPAKLHARSARAHAAAEEASSNTRRPRKAR